MFWLEAEGELTSGLEATNSNLQAPVRKSGEYRIDLRGNTPTHVLKQKESALVNGSWECEALCSVGVYILYIN